MEKVAEIPRILIYEEFDGHPIYRKGYKDYLLGLKKPEEIMGTSALQYFITSTIIKYLNRNLPESYLAGSSELGLHLGKNVNLATDIAIYREGQLQIDMNSIKYVNVPPNMVIEVDIRADESNYFRSEEDYFHKKTERLLQWGVERVIWVFSSSRRVLVADNLQKWETISWDLPFAVIDDYEINLWDLLIKNGLQA